MSVEIFPAELGFRRPFQQEVSQTLKINNPNHTPVAFKVKTTAPKQYCVRPNSGRIEPGKAVEVSVLLQPMKQEPPLDAKCRDKFLVQSVAVTADKEFSNIGAIWQHVDNAERSSVQEKKIRVAFLPAEGPASTPKRGTEHLSSNGGTDGLAPPAYTSPSPEPTFTPQQHSATAATGPVSTSSEKPAGSKSLGDAKASSTNPATRSTITSAAAAVNNNIPTSYEELKAQLTQAQTTIASYGHEGGLRMRKAIGATGDDSTTGTTDMSVRQQSSEGVPVQIVAALCLLSFLLAYLFF
ncbi:MAG: phosphatidylinositol-binding protein scs2 [Claussenomyces sp. TS43310]|nr:MAG: phosphatidylinositol-binding protein scs2 [Claussenomyces sp. TS43310]